MPNISTKKRQDLVSLFFISGQRIRTPFSSPVNNTKTIYLMLSYRPELYRRGIVSIKSRCEILGSQIQVWLIDLRLNNGSKQSIVFSNENVNVSIDSRYNSPFSPRPLTEVGVSNALNVTFDTTNNTLEFLWLGFNNTNKCKVINAS